MGGPQSTCDKEKCKLWDLFDGDCPNKIESFWENKMSAGVHTVTDCAPRRTMLFLQEIMNRLTALERDNNEFRNETVWVQVVAEVLGKSTGIDLERFVEERRRLLKIADYNEKLQENKSKELSAN